MRRVVLSVALALLVLPAAQQHGFTQEEGIEFKKKPPKASAAAPSGAPADPSSGPNEPYLYRNNAGVFKLSTRDADGVARYIWGDQRHEDRLYLIAYGEITDRTGIGVPIGQGYDIWLYEAMDKDGNKWYLAFGVDPLAGRNVPSGRYGLYYAGQSPLEGGSLKRWLTRNGTQRE